MNARGVLKFANEIMSHKYSNIYLFLYSTWKTACIEEIPIS